MITQYNLDAMMEAYIETALWSTNDESTEQGGEPFDENYTASDIDDASLQDMRADCEKFANENETLLAQYQGTRWSVWQMAGHDFWLTRNRHGTGFWDRTEYWGEASKKLAEAARKFGEKNLYLGDDGLIYQS